MIKTSINAVSFLQATSPRLVYKPGALIKCRTSPAYVIGPQVRAVTMGPENDTGNGNGEMRVTEDDMTPALLRHSGEVVRAAWRAAFQETGSNVAIDATAGRGSDTLSLSALAGAHGMVHTIDVQAAALEETAARHAAARKSSCPIVMSELRTHHASHADLTSVTGLTENVATVAYNLGWYPAQEADRSIITHADSTVQSLRSAVQLLAVSGVVSVMAYVGHPGGREEADAVRDWTTTLDRRAWTVVHLTYPNRHQAPELFLLQRLHLPKL